MSNRTSKTQNVPVLIMVVGGLLLLISAAWLFTQTPVSPAATPAATPTATRLPPVSGGHDEQTYPEIERVSIADAKAALDAGTAIFVDVRIAGAYKVDHIPGALNIPLGEVETRLSELDPNQWIITYCT